MSTLFRGLFISPHPLPRAKQTNFTSIKSQFFLDFLNFQALIAVYKATAPYMTVHFYLRSRESSADKWQMLQSEHMRLTTHKSMTISDRKQAEFPHTAEQILQQHVPPRFDLLKDGLPSPAPSSGLFFESLVLKSTPPSPVLYWSAMLKSAMWKTLPGYLAVVRCRCSYLMKKDFSTGFAFIANDF